MDGCLFPDVATHIDSILGGLVCGREEFISDALTTVDVCGQSGLETMHCDMCRWYLRRVFLLGVTGIVSLNWRFAVRASYFLTHEHPPVASDIKLI
jgi:hypothetical protein